MGPHFQRAHMYLVWVASCKCAVEATKGIEFQQQSGDGLNTAAVTAAHHQE